MVYDNGVKMVLNDTVPKKTYLSKNMQYCHVLEAENKWCIFWGIHMQSKQHINFR